MFETIIFRIRNKLKSKKLKATKQTIGLQRLSHGTKHLHLTSHNRLVLLYSTHKSALKNNSASYFSLSRYEIFGESPASPTCG